MRLLIDWHGTAKSHEIPRCRQAMGFVYDDGGRGAAGFKGAAGDCVTRALAIATGKPYLEVYDDLHAATEHYAATRRDRTAKSIQRGGGRRGTTPRKRHPQKSLTSLHREPGLALGCNDGHRHGVQRASARQ